MTRVRLHRTLATLTVAATLLATGSLASGCSKAPAAASGGSSSTAAAAGAGAGATSQPATRPAASTASTAKPAPAAKPMARTLPLPNPIAKIAAPKKAGTITGPRTLAVPMLMYHAIDEKPANAPFPDLYVSGPEFAAQLNYLSKNGYHAVTMQQVYDFWQGKGTLPTKPIVLTFDDGFTGQFEIATPLLKSIDWPATLFLIVGRSKPRMRAVVVRTMIANGWELGSHSITHEELTGESAKAMKDDVARSRTLLSKQFHVPVNFFCYPSGKFNDQVVAEVVNAGYLLATTTLPGYAKPSEPFRLRRIRVSGGESIKAFAASLAR